MLWAGPCASLHDLRWALAHAGCAAAAAGPGGQRVRVGGLRVTGRAQPVPGEDPRPPHARLDWPTTCRSLEELTATLLGLAAELPGRAVSGQLRRMAG